MLPRKNPRADSDDLDDEKRGNTSIINGSIDRVDGSSRRETIEVDCKQRGRDNAYHGSRLHYVSFANLRRFVLMTTFKTIY